jgi:hypothetical protein
MRLSELLNLMQTSSHGIYPRIFISDYGSSDVGGDFGYVDEVLALDDEYAFLLDAEVTHIDFENGVNGELYLDIQVQS